MLRDQILSYDLAAVGSVADVMRLKLEAESATSNEGPQHASHIWIYGASQLGRDIHMRAKSRGITVLGFIDRNPTLWNSSIQGIPVVPLSADIQDQIVVAIYNIGESLRNVRDVAGDRVVSYADFLLGLGRDMIPYWCLQSPYSPISSDDLENIYKFESQLDNQNRVEFARQLATRFMFGIEHGLPTTNTPADEYFAGCNSEISENELLLDIGAYDGDTARRFLERATNRSCRVTAIEPDPISYGRLRDRLGTDDRVHTVNALVGENLGSAYFEPLGTVRSRETIGQGVIVPKLTVDEIISFYGQPSRIKVDVEGAERNVLLGARGTIASKKSSWAISSYHRPEDLWQLPSFFEPSDYLVDVCSHAQRPWDTVLYLTPRHLVRT